MLSNSTTPSRLQFVRLCECGCGQPTLLARKSQSGSVRGQPLHYIHGHSNHGAHNPSWRGGRSVSSYGYVYRYCPEHPHANKDGCVFEHRLVMEASLGRYLRPEEVVHHIDGDKRNNAPENLQRFANQREHIRHHAGAGRWTRDYDACIDCGTTEREHVAGGRCERCRARWRARQKRLAVA